MVFSVFLLQSSVIFFPSVGGLVFGVCLLFFFVQTIFTLHYSNSLPIPLTFLAIFLQEPVIH